jgi:hypothetical protein
MAGAGTGTIHGTVTRGPIAPICRAGTPCTAPAKHVMLYFTRNSTTRTATTDAKGRYTIQLPAGLYAVKTSGRPVERAPQPRTVRVKAARSTRADFTIDTGIR